MGKMTFSNFDLRKSEQFWFIAVAKSCPRALSSDSAINTHKKKLSIRFNHLCMLAYDHGYFSWSFLFLSYLSSNDLGLITQVNPTSSEKESICCDGISISIHGSNAGWSYRFRYRCSWCKYKSTNFTFPFTPTPPHFRRQ